MNPVAIIAIGAIVCVGAAASAQTLSGSEAAKINEMIVVGARTPVPASRLGSPTTVINRDDIENRQARYVTDLLRSVPGLALSHSGVIGSQTQMRVRGSEANHVLVLIDGVRANDPATGDEFRWEYLSASNVERIEVVRGSQSALWGSDAIGAVINIISRSGSESTAFDSFIESGSNDAFNLGANAAGSVGNWRLSGAAESLDTDGANISRNGSESDGAELTTASLNARYANDAGWRFDAGLRALEGESQYDPIDFFTTGLPFDGDRVTDSDSLVGNVGASFTSDSGTTWQMRASFFDAEHRNLVDGVNDSASAADRVTYVLQSDFTLDENRLTLGIEHQDIDYEQRGAILFGDPNQSQNMQITSAIGEYQHLAGDRFTWIISGRYDDNSDFDNTLTGRIAMSYQLRPTTRLRSSIATGQKTPTFTERYGFFPDQFNGNADLKPEKSQSLDFGVDQDFLDGALSLQATFFWQQLRDEINGFVFDPVTFLSTAENRTGESDRSGVELAMNWRISDRVNFRANYTYTDATQENTPGLETTEIRRPENAGSLMLDYNSADSKFTAMLVADYGGSRFDLFFPPFPEPQQTVTLDSYWLVDFTAQYRLNQTISLFARGSNLLDDDYEQVFGFRTLGRTAYFGIRAGFGN